LRICVRGSCGAAAQEARPLGFKSIDIRVADREIILVPVPARPQSRSLSTLSTGALGLPNSW